MVGLEIRIDIEPEKRQEFLSTVRALIEAKREGAEGCVSREIFERDGDPNSFMWTEEWSERDLLDRHLETRDFRTLLGAVRVLGHMRDMRITTVESVRDGTERDVRTNSQSRTDR